MGLPFKKADAALQGYAEFLRERVVPSDGASPTVSTAQRADDCARACSQVPFSA